MFLLILKSNQGSTSLDFSDISKGLSKESANSNNNTSSKVLNAATFQTFKILKIKNISYNTKLIRFEIPFSQSLG